MATNRPKSLAPKASRFVEEYLLDLSATQAAIRAGYSPKTSAQAGYRLLRTPGVVAALELRMAEREKQTRIKSYRVLEELATVALSSIDHYAVDKAGNVTLAPGAPRDALRAVASVKRSITVRKVKGQADVELETIDTEIKLWDKNPALSNAMRHLGIQGADKIDHRDVTLEQLIAAAAAEDTDGDSAPPVG